MGAAFFVGTAGWSLSRGDMDRRTFPAEGTHLERYAAVFRCAEINSSFYRPLRPELYAKWAAATPPHFRFSVKIPKVITHEQRLLDCEAPLAAFLDEVQGLGEKLGCCLVQLPPSFEFDASLGGSFFSMFRALHDGAIALEPRHPTWFTHDAEALLREYDIARVAADPARVPEAAEPGADTSLTYFRLHGSPRIYWSRYEPDYLDRLAHAVHEAGRRADEVWCIFDNTASGSAIPNALELLERLTPPGRATP